MQREGTVPKLGFCLPSFNRKGSLAGEERCPGEAGLRIIMQRKPEWGGLRHPFEGSSSKTGAGNICNETIHATKFLRP